MLQHSQKALVFKLLAKGSGCPSQTTLTKRKHGGGIYAGTDLVYVGEGGVVHNGQRHLDDGDFHVVDVDGG